MLKDVPAVWAVGVPVMPLPATVPASANDCPGSTTYIRLAPTACDREPKEVELFTMPLIVAVPGFPDVLKIVPDAGMFPPSVACT